MWLEQGGEGAERGVEDRARTEAGIQGLVGHQGGRGRGSFGGIWAEEEQDLAPVLTGALCPLQRHPVGG